MIKRVWFGMLVMVLTFGMMVIGCDNNGNGNGAASLVGTWRYESNDIVATFILSGNGTFRVYQDDDVLVGMWSTSNSFLSVSFFMKMLMSNGELFLA